MKEGAERKPELRLIWKRNVLVLPRLVTEIMRSKGLSLGTK